MRKTSLLDAAHKRHGLWVRGVMATHQAFNL